MIWRSHARCLAIVHTTGAMSGLAGGSGGAQPPSAMETEPDEAPTHAAPAASDTPLYENARALPPPSLPVFHRPPTPRTWHLRRPQLDSLSASPWPSMHSSS